MNDLSALAPHQAAWLSTVALPAKASRRRHGPAAALLDIINVWEERKRFRWELDEMARTNPHLIEDIGLTKEALEAEVAKPFWKG
jgi:uncharacterized protein YjiS (DUF1127 family)